MIRFLKKLAADVPTPATNKVTLFVDTAGAWKAKNESGTVSDVGGGASILQQDAEPTSPSANDLWIDTDEVAAGGSGTTVAIATASRASTDIVLNSTAWADVDTALDLVLAAVAGDLIEVGASWITGFEATQAYYDVASIVSAAPVNYWSGGGGTASSQGIQAWRADSGGSFYYPAGGSVIRAAAAGDISAGNITLRLRYRTQTATNKTLLANADNRLHWWAKNYGQ